MFVAVLQILNLLIVVFSSSTSPELTAGSMYNALWLSYSGIPFHSSIPRSTAASQRTPWQPPLFLHFSLQSTSIMFCWHCSIRFCHISMNIQQFSYEIYFWNILFKTRFNTWISRMLSFITVVDRMLILVSFLSVDTEWFVNPRPWPIFVIQNIFWGIFVELILISNICSRSILWKAGLGLSWNNG